MYHPKRYDQQNRIISCLFAILRSLSKVPHYDSSQSTDMNIKLTELPIDERLRLVEDLWDSIASDQTTLPITDEQKEELDRRLDAYEVDRNRGRLATEAVREIRRKL